MNVQVTQEEADVLFTLLTIEIGGEDDKKDKTRANMLNSLRDKFRRDHEQA